MQSLIESTRAYGLLKAEGNARSLAHAYLLSFDDERNLPDALKIFAKIFFNCAGSSLSQKSERISSLIDKQNFADCLFFPETEKRFSVEDAERLGEECLLKPVEGDRKLFIVSDFSLATPQAQNKLLKLLEEPPEGVYFLLGATSEFAILPTVLSRVKRLEIRPFSNEETLAFLARYYGNKYGKEEYALCAAASGGSVGGAQNMIEGGAYKAVAESAFSLALAKPHELPVRIVKAGETKKKRELLSLLRVIFRDAALVKAGEEKAPNLKNAVFLRTEGIRVREIAKKYSLHALLYAQTAIADAELEVAFNAYFPQCLEVLTAKILRENGEV